MGLGLTIRKGDWPVPAWVMVSTTGAVLSEKTVRVALRVA